MMERFLEVIFLSEYKDKFMFKGGILVAAMDLDATIKGKRQCRRCREYDVSNNIDFIR